MRGRRLAAVAALFCAALPGLASAQSVPLDTGLLPLEPGAFELELTGTRTHGASLHVDWKGGGELPGDLDLDESVVRLRTGLSRRLSLRAATAWRRNSFLSERMGKTSTSGPAWTEVGLEWAPLRWRHRNGGMRLGLDAHIEARREGFFPVRSGRKGADLWFGSYHQSDQWGRWLCVTAGYRASTSNSPHDMGFISTRGGVSWVARPWLRLGLIVSAEYASNSIVGGAVMFNHPAYTVRAGLRADLIHPLPATELSLRVDRQTVVHNQLQGIRLAASLTIHLDGTADR